MFREVSNIDKIKETWDVHPDQYWARNEEAHKFTQGVKLHNFKFSAIEYIIEEMKAENTLDVGCGPRGLGSAANIDRERPKKIPDNFQIMDAHELHFLNNSFTKVSLLEVIEHVENPSQVLREIYRVLEDDGVLFLTTPNPMHISVFIKYLRNKRVRIHCDHINSWTWEMLSWLIHNTGFKDIQIYLWGFVDEMIREGKPVKLYRSYRLANLLYRLGIRNPMLHLNICVTARK